jgi:hypothetical protein
VLDSVADRLTGDEPGRSFDLRSEPPLGGPQLDPQRQPGRQVVEGRAETRLAEHRRVQTVCELAQLRDRGLDLIDPGADSVAEPVDVAVDRRGAQLQRQGEQPLLRAVVQVPLDPPPLGQLGCGDPGPGLADLGELQHDRGAQPGVLQLGRRLRRGRFGERTVDRCVVVADPRHRAVMPPHGDLVVTGPDGTPVSGDPLLPVLDPVRGPQGRVAERVAQHRLDARLRRRLAEVLTDRPQGVVPAPVEAPVDASWNAWYAGAATAIAASVPRTAGRCDWPPRLPITRPAATTTIAKVMARTPETIRYVTARLRIRSTSYRW